MISILLFWFVLGRGRKTTLASLIAIFAISITSSTAYIFFNASLRDNHFQKYYINILTRSPPFFLGILYGYVMNLLRGKRLNVPLVSMNRYNNLLILFTFRIKCCILKVIINIVYGFLNYKYLTKILLYLQILNILITISSLATIASALYLFFEYQQRGTDNINILNALDAFVRTLWCLGLGWIIFISSRGYGG